MRKCKGCQADISKKHINAKFCTKKCKDSYHNWANPRGKFAHLKDLEPWSEEYFADYEERYGRHD